MKKKEKSKKWKRKDIKRICVVDDDAIATENNTNDKGTRLDEDSFAYGWPGWCGVQFERNRALPTMIATIATMQQGGNNSKHNTDTDSRLTTKIVRIYSD